MSIYIKISLLFAFQRSRNGVFEHHNIEEETNATLTSQKSIATDGVWSEQLVIPLKYRSQATTSTVNDAATGTCKSTYYVQYASIVAGLLRIIA